MATAYLSLGANAGEPLAQLDEAERRIGAQPQTKLIAKSPDRRTAAGKPKQRDYLYRIIGIETDLKPRALLDRCIEIETAMGRDHGDVWWPRRIDIDIIAYDDIEIRSSRLHLPHPFAHSRDYIIGPLREIAPEMADFVLKVGTRPR